MENLTEALSFTFKNQSMVISQQVSKIKEVNYCDEIMSVFLDIEVCNYEYLSPQ